MTTNENLTKVDEKFKEVVNKNRLRLLLLYPEAANFLNSIQIIEAKKHVYYNAGEDKLTRRRIKVNTGEGAMNITAFEKLSTNSLPIHTTLINGKFVEKERIIGTTFTEAFHTSEVGQKFLVKLFEDFDLEKVCKDLKKK